MLWLVFRSEIDCTVAEARATTVSSGVCRRSIAGGRLAKWLLPVCVYRPSPGARLGLFRTAVRDPQAAITVSRGFFEGKEELQTIKMWSIPSSDLQLVATFRAGVYPIVGVSWRSTGDGRYQVAR